VSSGSLGGDIVAVTVFKVKMFMSGPSPGRAFLTLTGRRAGEAEVDVEMDKITFWKEAEH